MTVGELITELNKYDKNMEVLTKQAMISGEVAYINSVMENSYRFYGMIMPCILLTDEYIAE